MDDAQEPTGGLTAAVFNHWAPSNLTFNFSSQLTVTNRHPYEGFATQLSKDVCWLTGDRCH